MESDEGRTGADDTDEVEGVVFGVVWNGLYQRGVQVLPLWQPVIAATDKRANAPRRIELRIFRCPLEWTRSRSHRAATSLSWVRIYGLRRSK